MYTYCNRFNLTAETAESRPKAGASPSGTALATQVSASPTYTKHSESPLTQPRSLADSGDVTRPRPGRLDSTSPTRFAHHPLPPPLFGRSPAWADMTVKGVHKKLYKIATGCQRRTGAAGFGASRHAPPRLYRLIRDHPSVDPCEQEPSETRNNQQRLTRAGIRNSVALLLRPRLFHDRDLVATEVARTKRRKAMQDQRRTLPPHEPGRDRVDARDGR